MYKSKYSIVSKASSIAKESIERSERRGASTLSDKSVKFFSENWTVFSTLALKASRTIAQGISSLSHRYTSKHTTATNLISDSTKHPAYALQHNAHIIPFHSIVADSPVASILDIKRKHKHQLLQSKIEKHPVVASVKRIASIIASKTDSQLTELGVADSSRRFTAEQGAAGGKYTRKKADPSPGPREGLSLHSLNFLKLPIRSMLSLSTLLHYIMPGRKECKKIRGMQFNCVWYDESAVIETLDFSIIERYQKALSQKIEKQVFEKMVGGVR